MHVWIRPLLLLSCLFLTLSAQADVTFSNSGHPLPGFGGNIALGDFNRDGKPDIAVQNTASGGTVSVLLGPGFSTRRDSSTLGGRMFGESANFNGSSGTGALDLIVAYNDQAKLTVLLGNGDGTFRRGADLNTSYAVGQLALGDFNNDQRVDLATIECGSPGCYVLLYLGNGDGTFGLRYSAAAGAATSLAVTDLNRDGKTDVAVAARAPSRGLVYLGNGDGTLSGPATTINLENPIDPTFQAESDPSVYATDFDNDTTPDLVFLAGNYCGGSACGDMYAHSYHNNGYGAFTRRSRFLVLGSSGTGDLVVTDLTGDSRPDLVVFSGEHFGGGNNYWQGNGDGTFTRIDTNLYTGDIADFAARDLDLDSRHDLVTTSWSDEGVLVARNTSAPTNCAAPGSDAIRSKICTPGATAPSTFVVRGSGNSPAGVKRMELWVDGSKAHEIWNDQLRHELTLPAGEHRLALVAVDQYASWATSNLTVNVGAGGSEGCAATSGDRTVTICAPLPNSTVSSPVRVSAAADPGSSAVKAMQIYVDGVKRFEQAGTTVIDTELAMSAGTHRITVQAVDSAGAFKSTVYITVSGATTSCPAPATARTINLCSPVNGQTYDSPVLVHATAKAGSSAIKAMQLYVDGVKRFETSSGNELKTSVALSSGQHRITVQAIDSAGAFKATVYITVR